MARFCRLVRKKDEDFHTKIYRPFHEAREFARGLGLKNQAEWKTWSRSNSRPEDIPKCPEAVYKKEGWAGMSDWLGTRNKKGGYRPFQEAREFARNLGLHSEHEWKIWLKSGSCPEDIPASPQSVYKGNGWAGIGDWLGTGNRKHNYRSFQEARTFVRSIGLQSQSEWLDWTRSDSCPDDIPAFPDAVYKEGWAGISDWIGFQGKVDVLISSVPVGTGVDGLQYVCNRMIVISLPWTSAEYEQLIGRLYRQGSAFDKVEVIIS